MSYVILLASRKLLMVNKMYISNISKLMHPPLRLFPHGKEIGEISNFIYY